MKRHENGKEEIVMFKRQAASQQSQKNSVLMEELYTKYHKLMYYVAAKALQDSQDIEDALFATWEKVLKDIQKFYEATELQKKSLLIVFLKTTIIDMTRQQALEAKSLQAQEQKKMAAEDKKNQKPEVIEWLRSISGEYSDILILYYIHGYKLAEISNLLNVAENTISRKLKKGVTLLRKEMGEDL